MSIDITELDASLTLRNLSKEEKQAVVRLMELSIIETKAATQARIVAYESAINKAVSWLHHYPSPENTEEQTESNRRRALVILEKVLRGEQ